MAAKEIFRTGCPHDCPSVCALEVERRPDGRLGAVRGAEGNSYTLGVTCAKMARYAERVHHPDRLTQPLLRVSEKGSGSFRPISWDEALDRTADAFSEATERYGSEAVWPFHSGGNMGLVQRYGMERLRHAMRYSGERASICIGIGVPGWLAGVGRLVGTDPREIADSDLIVVWGTNPVATQVNLMTHIARARKERGAKLVVVDCYETATAKVADYRLILRPGTDGALACAVMGVLLREGLVDRDYLASYTDFDKTVERHLIERTPGWAAALTGLAEDEIIAFARLFGSTPRSFVRLGLGFTRSRNGAANLHAVSCLPAMTGAWRHRGGGAFFINADGWGLDYTVVQGLDVRDPAIRVLDQPRIGAVLGGDPGALYGGPPVKAMLVQNANPAVTAPDTAAILAGLARPDLFLCVHEQFMTETARMADIVLPATTFLEQDDLFMGWGHTHLVLAPRVLEPLGQARSNHDVICGLARRLGATHRGFFKSAWELVDDLLTCAGLPNADTAAATGWIDRAPDFRAGHFLDGFPTPDGRFRFRPQWSELGPLHGPLSDLPDHAAITDAASPDYPFRLVTPPTRSFLNTTFTETPSSRRREGAPRLLMHPDDWQAVCGESDDGILVKIGNRRGSLTVPAQRSGDVRPGVVVLEGLWLNADFADGIGVNLLTDAVSVAPAGGAAFHDVAIWVRRA